MKTGKYFVKKKETCWECIGEGEYGVYVVGSKKYEMRTCDLCNETGFISTEIPLEEALVDLGYVPMQLKDLTEEQEKNLSQFMREFFPDMHKRFYPNEEKPSEHLRAEYRGCTLKKVNDNKWDFTLCHENGIPIQFRMMWEDAIARIDAELRKGIPEPQF